MSRMQVLKNPNDSSWNVNNWLRVDDFCDDGKFDASLLETNRNLCFFYLSLLSFSFWNKLSWCMFSLLWLHQDNCMQKKSVSRFFSVWGHCKYTKFKRLSPLSMFLGILMLIGVVTSVTAWLDASVLFFTSGSAVQCVYSTSKASQTQPNCCCMLNGTSGYGWCVTFICSAKCTRALCTAP